MSSNTTISKRKPNQLNVPTIEDDPSERKRVLNVLAQRRYRRRKKEQVQALEKEVRQMSNSTSSEDGSRQGSATRSLPLPSNESHPEVNYTYHNTDISPEDDFGIDPDDIFPQVQSSEMTCFDPSVFEAMFPVSSVELPSLPPTPSLVMSGDTSQSQSLSCWDGLSTSQPADFPDERHLPLLELNLLRASMSVAQRLKVDGEIWSLEALSPFHNTTPEMYLHLPANLRPTMMQLTTPHHPVFDILPWPSVREKLIMVFMQPIDMRPPIARSSTALVDFVYDLEDPAEGVRVWGSDPHSDKNWEVGKKLFRNWWWALDSDVVGRSNELRKQRGAALLTSERERVIEELE